MGLKPLQLYTGYRWDALNKHAMGNLLANYKPYIVALGIVDGVELYQVNGDNNFCYVTNKRGAEEADKALRKVAEEYDK